MEIRMAAESDRPAWDEQAATRLLGAKVLIGITRRSARDEPDSHEQMHGEVASVDPVDGICIKLHGARQGEYYWLPPDLGSFRPLPPGDYEIVSTGEEVADPEFISHWTIDPPVNS
jgi:hypothetical protein